MTDSNLLAYKDQSTSVLHKKALRLLNRHARKTSGGIITFPEARRVLSWLFHLSKSESREFLKELTRAGLIEVKPFHGIRILNKDQRRLTTTLEQVTSKEEEGSVGDGDLLLL